MKNIDSTKIIHYPHPILRQKCDLFPFDDENNNINPIYFADVLAKAMMEHNGLGLSAPQIGVPLRVISIRTNPIITMYNPILVNISDEFEDGSEGCLSFPDIFLNIKRPKHIKVRYVLPNQQIETNRFEGLTARIICHEIDHLNANLFIDYVSKLKYDIAKRKSEKRKKN